VENRAIDGGKQRFVGIALFFRRPPGSLTQTKINSTIKVCNKTGWLLPCAGPGKINKPTGKDEYHE